MLDAPGLMPSVEGTTKASPLGQIDSAQCLRLKGVAVGLFGSKLNVVIPGLSTSELRGLETAYTGSGLSFQYFPSVMEWLVFVWAVSLGALLFLGGREIMQCFRNAQTV